MTIVQIDQLNAVDDKLEKELPLTQDEIEIVIPSLSPIAKELLRPLIRNAFDECGFLMAKEYIQIARELGFHDLAKEMEEDSRYA